MQLSGLLEKLKGVFSVAFLLATLTPLMCAVLINGAILAQYNRTVGGWIADFLNSDNIEKTLVGGVGLLGLIVVAYVFSAFNLALREVLEGKHLPKWLDRILCDAENDRLKQLVNKIAVARQGRRTLQKESDKWLNDLRNARQQGIAKTQCIYSQLSQSIEELQKKSERSEVLTAKDLNTDVKTLVDFLSKNSTDLNKYKPDAGYLDHDHQRMVELIEYAKSKAEADYVRLYNEKEFNFSRYTVAATRLGNVAGSVVSYADSRYSMNLDFVWSRLQKMLLGDSSKFYELLRDAKIQVDFAVSMFWVTTASTLVWAVLLPFVANTFTPFLAIIVVGPLLARGWYLVAVQNYRAFADLLRSAIDLFRLQLLKELKLKAPSDSAVESQLWDLLNQKLCYGDDVLLTFKND